MDVVEYADGDDEDDCEDAGYYDEVEVPVVLLVSCAQEPGDKLKMGGKYQGIITNCLFW